MTLEDFFDHYLEGREDCPEGLGLELARYVSESRFDLVVTAPYFRNNGPAGEPVIVLEALK